MDPASRGDMTLVFALAAIVRFANPAVAIADARQWSERVGVTGPDPDAVETGIERAGIDPDFVSGRAGMVGSLAALRQRSPSDRHVFIGTSDEDRDIAEALGWEYLSIEDAAERAGWTLDGTSRRR